MEQYLQNSWKGFRDKLDQWNLWNYPEVAGAVTPTQIDTSKWNLSPRLSDAPNIFANGPDISALAEWANPYRDVMTQKLTGAQTNQLLNPDLIADKPSPNAVTNDTVAKTWKDMGMKDKLTTVGGLALGAAGAWNTFQANKLARDQLNFTKSSWNKQFEANRRTTNAALADRQAARVASNPGAYESQADYMKKYGV